MKKIIKEEIVDQLISFKSRSEVLKSGSWWIGVKTALGDKGIAKELAMAINQAYIDLVAEFINELDNNPNNFAKGMTLYSEVNSDEFFIGGAIAILMELNSMLKRLVEFDRRDISREMFDLSNSTITEIIELLEIED